MADPQVFVWDGKERNTIGELMDAMHEVFKTGDKQLAANFMREYQAVNLHAAENIGYLTGYSGPKEAEELRAFFDVSHPIFGRSSPTTEAALEAGKRTALGEFS